jgi:DNA-binding response OmpR family regulator
MNILLVEDNLEMARLIAKFLERNHYLVTLVHLLEDAVEAVVQFDFDLIILDRCLGEQEGLALIDFCDRKAKHNRFIILSALDASIDRISGLKAGAIDYIVKPFEPDELLERVKIALNYPKPERDALETLAGLSFDPASRAFLANGRTFDLRRREALLLEALFKRGKRIVSRETLHDAIFGMDSYTSETMLDPHISRLRKKLKSVGSGVGIRTHRGLGYSLEFE